MTSATQSRKASNGSARKPAASKARKPAARSSQSAIPSWTATVASIIGAGVAVGVGLCATRRQWLPKAEQWSEDLNHRFHDLRDRYSSTANDDHDAYEEGWDGIDTHAAPSFPDAKSVA